MAVKISINKLRETQNSLDSIRDSINSSRASNLSLISSTISMGKDYINKYQQAIYDCEKDINLAKKAIDHNQSAIYRLDKEISRLGQIISQLEWEISRTGYPKKPNSTGNTEVDAANRREWEDACDEVDRKLEQLRSQKETASRSREQYIQVKEKAEDNISELQRIIRNIKADIENLKTLIHNLNVKIEDLKRAESTFIMECNNTLSSLRKIDGRISDAIVNVSNAIGAFKQAGITMNESSVIDISDINKCNVIFRDIKNKLISANQSGSILESSIVNAQRNLKDNVTTEVGVIIDKIKAEYSRVVDALEQINKAVDTAMEYLRQYENC